MSNIVATAISTAIFACGCAHSSAPKQASGLAPGRYKQRLQSGGLNRQLILHVPPAYDGSHPIPVVVVLHGWTSNALEAETYTQMAQEGDSQGFATVFPDGLGKPRWQGWNAGFINLTGEGDVDDVKFISDLLDYVEKELKVDPNREYVCGHSNGAFLANLVGAKLSRRLAAIASVAGTIGLGDKTIPAPQSPISVLLIHGKADATVAYDKTHRALLTGRSAEQSARWWADQDGCNEPPTLTRSSDGNVTTELFSDGKDSTQVELISIANGAHAWPGGYGYGRDGKPERETTTGVNAADLIWTFFQTHPKPTPKT